MVKKVSFLQDLFRGDHVTIILKTRNDSEDREGNILQSYIMSQGIIVEVDDEFIYLSNNVDIGITEAVGRKDVLKIILTDLVESNEDLTTCPDKGKIN